MKHENEINNSGKWKTVEYSRSKIIKSGKLINRISATEEERMEAKKVINNWRAAHAYPLHIIYMYLRRLSGGGADTIVAERLKRLESIIFKLKRFPNMSLWEMQDLGGCRLVVSSVNDVYRYVEKIKKSRIRHVLLNENDYICQPKKDGYRSYHLVYRFHSDTRETFNRNILIEIQIRTRMQHIWATAVETMAVYSRQALKSGIGDEGVKRFFSLVSTLIAIKENCNVVPETPSIIEDIVRELKEIDNENHYLDILKAIRVATKNRKRRMIENGYNILILNYETKRISFKSFKAGENRLANEEYQKIESSKGAEQVDVVLVGTSSFKSLQAAYPNYFLDIGDFVKIVSEYLE